MTRANVQWGSFGIGVVLTLTIAGVASIPHCSAVGVLLLPGMLLAAVVFREGVNSNGAWLYVALAAFIEIAIFAGIVYLIWNSWLLRKGV